MCGIVGIFGEGWTRLQLEAMVASQRHRGPDAEGVYVAPSGMAGLGHNRLSIIDLSDAGRQPMNDPARRYWIMLNGEIYNSFFVWQWINLGLMVESLGEGIGSE